MTKKEAYSRLRWLSRKLAIPADRREMLECLSVLTDNGNPDTLDK
jgi:hypothetical protein